MTKNKTLIIKPQPHNFANIRFREMTSVAKKKFNTRIYGAS